MAGRWCKPSQAGCKAVGLTREGLPFPRSSLLQISRRPEPWLRPVCRAGVNPMLAVREGLHGRASVEGAHSTAHSPKPALEDFLWHVGEHHQPACTAPPREDSLTGSAASFDLQQWHGTPDHWQEQQETGHFSPLIDLMDLQPHSGMAHTDWVHPHTAFLHLDHHDASYLQDSPMDWLHDTPTSTAQQHQDGPYPSPSNSTLAASSSLAEDYFCKVRTRTRSPYRRHTALAVSPCAGRF